MKSAATARCDAVEQLYELLDVPPEKPITRDGKNGRYEVATDKDESKRASRLVEAVTLLLAREDEPVPHPAATVGGRVADAMQLQHQTPPEQRFAPAAPG